VRPRTVTIGMWPLGNGANVPRIVERDLVTDPDVEWSESIPPECRLAVSPLVEAIIYEIEQLMLNNLTVTVDRCSVSISKRPFGLSVLCTSVRTSSQGRKSRPKPVSHLASMRMNRCPSCKLFAPYFGPDGLETKGIHRSGCKWLVAAAVMGA